MGKKSKTFILAFLAIAGSRVTAGAQVKLVITPWDSGSPASEVRLGDVSKITFADDDFTVSLFEGTASTFAFRNVKTIRFEDVASGIDAPGTDGQADGTLYYRDGFLRARSVDGSRMADAAVYDLSGRMVMAEPHWDGTPISTAGLQKGVYVFKVNNRTIKFTK